MIPCQSWGSSRARTCECRTRESPASSAELLDSVSLALRGDPMRETDECPEEGRTSDFAHGYAKAGEVARDVGGCDEATASRRTVTVRER